MISRSNSRIVSALQELVVSLPLGIPAVLFGIGFLFTFTQSFLHLYGKPWALILVYVTIVMPFAVRIQLAAMTNLGDDLDAAAAVSGAGLARRILVIDLPLLRASLAAGAALVVVLASHEFAASILVRTTNTQVMGTALYDLYAFGSYPQSAVMALVMCVVTGAGVGVALILGGRGIRGAGSNGG
jgi:iron(III) transport system permease protein